MYFTIVPKKVSGLKASSQTTTTSTLKWSKVSGSVRYKVYKYNSYKNKYEFIGSTSSTSYKVKNLKTGTAYKFKVRAYKKVDGDTFDGSYSSILSTATKTKTPTLKTLTSPSKGKAKLTWSNVSGETKYQIYGSTNGLTGFKLYSTVGANTTSKTLTGLISKRTYYVKVRTYKLVNGKKIYSSYSSVKKIKVK